jgi:hypothetical protein
MIRCELLRDKGSAIISPDARIERPFARSHNQSVD